MFKIHSKFHFNFKWQNISTSSWCEKTGIFSPIGFCGDCGFHMESNIAERLLISDKARKRFVFGQIFPIDESFCFAKLCEKW